MDTATVSSPLRSPHAMQPVLTAAEALIMSSRLKPWSRAKVRRVLESHHGGGYTIERSPCGWVVSLTDSSPQRPRYYLIPFPSLEGRSLRWLGARLLGALRRAALGMEGVERIDGREAWRLRCWLVRWVRRPRRSAAARRRAAARSRAWVRRMRDTVAHAGYQAERSRRGWVLRLHAPSGRSAGIYLIPFRALGRPRRDWWPAPLVAGMARSLRSLPRARRITRAEARRLLRGSWEPKPGEVWRRIPARAAS